MPVIVGIRWMMSYAVASRETKLMSLSGEDSLLLGTIYQRLDDKPLKPGEEAYREFYQPVYSAPGCEDPVNLMHRHIKWSPVTSLQMFSGFSGSGKTTELLRLKQRLEDEGYIVLYADALNYLNPAEKIDITDLLIVLAGAYSDALEHELKIDIAGENYWERLKNYLLNTDVGMPDPTVKMGVNGPLSYVVGGLKAGLDLKLTLKTTPSFREKLQQAMANRIGELKNQVDKFIEDGVKAIRKARDDDNARVVFIFDSLEQIRGSLFNEQEVIRSVERLFTNHLMLHLPYVHAVYTVPPWLKFALPNTVKLVLLPSIRQWDNDGARSRCDNGWDALRSLARKRFGEGGCKRVFGEPDAEGHFPLADKIIGLCGGHFRDLLLLFREMLTRVEFLPVSEEVVDAAIVAVRRQFLPIPVENARWLHQIARLRQTALMTDRPEDVNRLTRFLDTHFVLYFTNGEDWYDIHPLIREEVEAIIEQHGERDDARSIEP